MFYVTQLHAGDWYVCPYQFTHKDSARVPADLDHAYARKADALAARDEAERRYVVDSERESGNPFGMYF